MEAPAPRPPCVCTLRTPRVLTRKFTATFMVCPAIDPKTKARCSQPVLVWTRATCKAGTWCWPHYHAQKSHYKRYKKDSDAFAQFDDSKICMDHARIGACCVLQILAGWAVGLREKLSHCRNAICSRQYHHDRFHGGGDEAHIRFIRYLHNQRRLIELTLEVTNKRHDELSGTTATKATDHDPEEIEAVMEYHTPATDRFPLDASTLLARLFSFRKFERIHREPDDQPRWARFVDFMERIIILAMQARSGMRTLLASPRALDVDVETFLSDNSLITMDELQQIYVAVHLMPPPSVLHAINDAFRSEAEDDPHTLVLRRRIYANPAIAICLDAWDMFEDLMPRRHWAIQASPNLTAWTEVDRIASLGLRFNRWQSPRIMGDSGTSASASIIFPLSGVFVQREWDREIASRQIREYKQRWVEKDRPAALYLTFSKSTGTLFFQRVVSTLQKHPQFFGVLPLASGHFTASTDAGTSTVIPRIPTILNSGRQRFAESKGKLKEAEWVDLPYFTLDDLTGPTALSDPGGVLHLLVTDCTQSGKDSLRNNLAAVLLFVKLQHSPSESDEPPSERAFLSSEMRILCNPTVAPALGLGQEGLVAIAAGVIHVEGEHFKHFKDRLTQILERHADENLVKRWEKKKMVRQRKDGVRCWDKQKRKLERIACCQEFFFLGTPEGHAHLRKKLGREISSVEGAVQKYDEDLSHHVFETASARSQAAEKMLPPREIPMDWENEVHYPDTINCSFNFMREATTLEPANAMIVELMNDRPQ
ncbi:hypothetical protein C8F01DRAFT_748979 [Mycena amicta]|nr:hypothetical protein C8F01DRAFT_748979 [Mycena amicta]